MSPPPIKITVTAGSVSTTIDVPYPASAEGTVELAATVPAALLPPPRARGKLTDRLVKIWELALSTAGLLLKWFGF